MKKKVLLTLITFAVLCSCSDSDSTPEVQNLNIELNVQQRSIRDKGDDFANNLLLNASESDENVLLSPLSLQFVLGMIANGADEEAYTEIVNTLGLADYSLEELNTYHQTLTKGLDVKVENIDFSLGNAVWVQEGFSVKTSFLEKMETYYEAPVKYLDFGDIDKAKKEINQWAYKATGNTIKDLQLPLQISTKLVLNNACYFNGKWKSPFNEADTREGDFTNENGDVVKVKFMQGKKDLYYLNNGRYSQVSMPFTSGFIMSVILPEENLSIEDVLPEVDWNTAEDQQMSVDLQIPKFELEVIKNLNETLGRMGIKKIYSTEALPGIADGLSVSLIQQNTYMGISESGVKVATTTSGTMDPSSNVLLGATMKLNRPFAFAIREISSQTLLFIGKVSKLGE